MSTPTRYRVVSSNPKWGYGSGERCNSGIVPGDEVVSFDNCADLDGDVYVYPAGTTGEDNRSGLGYVRLSDLEPITDDAPTEAPTLDDLVAALRAFEPDSEATTIGEVLVTVEDTVIDPFVFGRVAEAIATARAGAR